jgi:hypothetical protein
MNRSLARAAARCVLALSALVALLGGGQAVLADTTTETGISVTIVDAGSLDVAWAGEGSTFLVNGEPPAISAGSPTVTATAAFSVVIADSRWGDALPGYQIALSAGSLTASDSNTAIGPELLTVLDVSGLPEGLSAATAIGATLDGPVTILSVPDGAPAVNTTLVVTVAMTIEAGIMPGAYDGRLAFEVIPALGP